MHLLRLFTHAGALGNGTGMGAQMLARTTAKSTAFDRGNVNVEARSRSSSSPSLEAKRNSEAPILVDFADEPPLRSLYCPSGLDHAGRGATLFQLRAEAHRNQCPTLYRRGGRRRRPHCRQRAARRENARPGSRAFPARRARQTPARRNADAGRLLARPYRARARRQSSIRSSAATTEIERVISILARRSKNNPCLVGEPGVGKTAIVEGLAQRIVARQRSVRAAQGKRVLALSLGPLVAGTKYRGEFEGRVKRILDEVKRSARDVDPLHRRTAHARRRRRRRRRARSRAR